MTATFLQSYTTEISNHLDYLPTWPINTDVKLGDVGILEDGVFKRTDTLERLGIDKLIVRKGQGTVTLEHASRDGVEFALEPSAETAIKGLGGKVVIKFNREGAVFLRVGDYVIEQFESTDQLGKEVIQRFKEGNWKRDRVVVTEVVTAPATTLLVSGSHSALASFSLDASLPAMEALSKGRFSQLVGLTGSFSTKVIGENVSPLLRISGLKTKWYGGNDFRSSRGRTNEDNSNNLSFGRIDSVSQLQE